MGKMARIAVSFGLFLGFVGFGPVGFAQGAYTPLNDACSTAPNSATCKSRGTGIENPVTGANGTIMRVINIISVIGGVIAVLIMIVAGIRMAASQGDPKAISEAKKAIVAVLIGLAVLATARLIVSLIIKGVT